MMLKKWDGEKIVYYLDNKKTKGVIISKSRFYEGEIENEEIAKLLALFDEIKNWQEPTKKGRFTYDDKAFVESLKKQFADKGQLSEKQLGSYVC